MRPYKPAPLPLKSVPMDLVGETATCPVCDSRSGVIGRLGLRLVFRCSHCRARFHRMQAHAGLV